MCPTTRLRSWSLSALPPAPGSWWQGHLQSSINYAMVMTMQWGTGMVKDIANVVKNVMAGSHEIIMISNAGHQLDLGASCKRDVGDRRPTLGRRRTCSWDLLFYQALGTEQRDTIPGILWMHQKRTINIYIYVRFVQYLLEVGNKERAWEFNVISIHTDFPSLSLIRIFSLCLSIRFRLDLVDRGNKNRWGRDVGCFWVFGRPENIRDIDNDQCLVPERSKKFLPKGSFT